MARATAPERIAVRMYQVGFGDCFLVSVTYGRPLHDGRAERHRLVDFGSTHSPKGQRLDMAAIAKRIGADCGGKLDAVVVTHRHKDHLSGFANDEAFAVIEALDPTLVVQPWTENPEAVASATGPVGVASRPRRTMSKRSASAHSGTVASRATAQINRSRAREARTDCWIGSCPKSGSPGKYISAAACAAASSRCVADVDLVRLRAVGDAADAIAGSAA